MTFFILIALLSWILSGVYRWPVSAREARDLAFTAQWRGLYLAPDGGLSTRRSTRQVLTPEQALRLGSRLPDLILFWDSIQKSNLLPYWVCFTGSDACLREREVMKYLLNYPKRLVIRAPGVRIWLTQYGDFLAVCYTRPGALHKHDL